LIGLGDLHGDFLIHPVKSIGMVIAQQERFLQDDSFFGLEQTIIDTTYNLVTCFLTVEIFVSITGTW
jgi:hypothetical protein